MHKKLVKLLDHFVRRFLLGRVQKNRIAGVFQVNDLVPELICKRCDREYERNDFGCTRIINTGVAGSLDNAINIGDIVVSTDAVQHDFDVTPIGFERGEIPYTGLYSFPADETLRALAVSAVRSSAPEIQVFEGRVCSGDQFIASREQKETILANFGGECCEMEGGAIAQACYLNNTPFVIIRAISDKADDSEEVSFKEFEEEAAVRCAAIVRYMISHE